MEISPEKKVKLYQGLRIALIVFLAVIVASSFTNMNYDQYDKSNVSIEDDLVKSYSKTNKTKDMIYIDYGASILRRDVLNLVPEGEVCSLDELFVQLIEQQQFLAYEVKERFYQIGSIDGIEEFKQYISQSGGKG